MIALVDLPREKAGFVPIHAGFARAELARLWREISPEMPMIFETFAFFRRL